MAQCNYPLTQNLILQKTKMSDLRYVKKLNVCGAQMDDISILQDAPNLEVLSLSVNHVEDLTGLSSTNGLKELYIRKNLINDIRQVLHLSEHHGLEVLNLADNPITSTAHYRKYVISAVPSLMKLDDVEISHKERQESESMFPGLHQERPPSPPQFVSPPRPASASNLNTARRSPPPSMESSPQEKKMMQRSAFDMQPGQSHAAQPQQAAAAPPQRVNSFSNNTSFATNNGSFSSAEVRDVQPLRRTGSGLAEAKKREVMERKREDNAVMAVSVLMQDMSTEGLLEVQRQLNALLR